MGLSAGGATLHLRVQGGFLEAMTCELRLAWQEGAAREENPEQKELRV